MQLSVSSCLLSAMTIGNWRLKAAFLLRRDAFIGERFLTTE
jgi:hypothetical protein